MTSADLFRTHLHSLSDLGADFLTPPPAAQEERRRRAKEARKLQVLHWQEWEQNKVAAVGTETGRGRVDCKKVSFLPRDRLRDAVMMSNPGEGEVISQQ